MFKEARFQSPSTAAKPVLYHVEGKDTPQLAANKIPTYTKLSYTIEAKASLNNIVDLLDNFYRAEKLHQVREFKVRRWRWVLWRTATRTRGSREWEIGQPAIQPIRTGATVVCST